MIRYGLVNRARLCLTKYLKHYFTNLHLDSPESTNAINDRIVVNASDSVDIACTFDGNPAPQVTWIKSGVPDVLGEGLKLSFQSVKQEDSGVYQCTATSSLGSAHNNVTLVVRGPPIITSEQGTMLTKSLYFS